MPPLDANLELGPSADGGTQLALRGSYRLPADPHGPDIDRQLLRAVAGMTSHLFLTLMAAALDPTSPRPAAASLYRAEPVNAAVPAMKK
jgi:hypothetical protein